MTKNTFENLNNNPEKNWESKLIKAKEFMYKKIGPGINMSILQNGQWSDTSYGSTDQETHKTAPDIYYDIASMTKVFTALQILELVESGEISLEDKLSKYLPQMKNFEINIADTLSHRGKLSLTNEKYQKGSAYLGRDLVRIFENSNNLELLTPDDYNYGDIGYMQLGNILTKVRTESLDECLQKFTTKYNLDEIVYNPVSKNIDMSRIAQSDQLTLPGEVQDEKAKWYNGMSGHAGIFATQNGLKDFVSTLLSNKFQQGLDKSENYFTPDYVKSPRTGMAFSVGGWRRGLFSKQPNISGFTGPSIFIEPKSKKAIVHTCNVTFPSREVDRTKYRDWNKSLVQ
jgi:CubicO group peptidase (beta-lactamase class C family)